MKTYIIAVVILLLSSFPSLAKESPLNNEVQANVNSVFIPGPFGTNADVYVIVRGLFQNSCYAWSRAEIRNLDYFNHEVKIFATVTQSPCVMVLIPFENEVRFGKLLTGEHKLRFINGDGTYLEDALTVD